MVSIILILGKLCSSIYVSFKKNFTSYARLNQHLCQDFLDLTKAFCDICKKYQFLVNVIKNKRFQMENAKQKEFEALFTVRSAIVRNTSERRFYE